MRFLDRTDELARLLRVSERREGGLVVVYGRRRIGKTRLLLEWSRRTKGLYTVADQSAPDIQRRYFAEGLAARLRGFADVEYRDWGGLLARLARDAESSGWRGPVIMDELPYLVMTSPELPSVLQRWLDHDAREAKLVVALAGSSQRMMQGLVLSADAPLYGRAEELLDLGPIEAGHLSAAFETKEGRELVDLYTAWGGIPRYWELAREVEGPVASQVDQLVLDPLGALHREPDRLLLEELPPAVETRPILDAIGMGAHRVTAIGGRLGRPATSMSRPLERLVSMGLVRREVPFGESEKSSRRSLYRIDDSFFRLWFRVVAPNRGALAAGTRAARLRLLNRHWPGLAAQAWEELCRRRLARLREATSLGRLGPWEPASRWWQGDQPEWDVVSRSLDGETILVGEAKWSRNPLGATGLADASARLLRRPLPPPVAEAERHGTIVVRALFAPAFAGGKAEVHGTGIHVMSAAELFS
jgi:AAA+ ATPase superfamily predicted ATPase